MTIKEIEAYSRFVDQAERAFIEQLADPDFYPARHSFWHAIATGHFILEWPRPDWPGYDC